MMWKSLKIIRRGRTRNSISFDVVELEKKKDLGALRRYT